MSLVAISSLFLDTPIHTLLYQQTAVFFFFLKKKNGSVIENHPVESFLQGTTNERASVPGTNSEVPMVGTTW